MICQSTKDTFPNAPHRAARLDTICWGSGGSRHPHHLHSKSAGEHQTASLGTLSGRSGSEMGFSLSMRSFMISSVSCSHFNVKRSVVCEMLSVHRHAAHDEPRHWVADAPPFVCLLTLTLSTARLPNGQWVADAVFSLISIRLVSG